MRFEFEPLCRGRNESTEIFIDEEDNNEYEESSHMTKPLLSQAIIKLSKIHGLISGVEKNKIYTLSKSFARDHLNTQFKVFNFHRL